MTAYTVEPQPTPAAFLGRAEAWLRGEEDRHNLLLGLALARETVGDWPEDACFAVVERAGDVVGCVVRTPPYKVLLTDLPVDAAGPVVELLAHEYASVPAFFGPPEAASSVARAWGERTGREIRPGMPQGLYRIDEVVPPRAVGGAMRLAGEDDVDLLVEWGRGFGRDTGHPFPAGIDPIRSWIEAEALVVWEDDGRLRSMAGAHGRTGRGARIGYVYTPPEERRRGYAAALVAGMTRHLLDGGLEFCVLYTDLTNPGSNALYRGIGYRLIEELRDFDVA